MPLGTYPPRLSISSGLLEEDHVLLDAVEHRVLSPHVAEPSLDVVGVVGVDAAAGEQPEDPDEDQQVHAQQQGELEDERQALGGAERGVDRRSRELDQRIDGGLVPSPTERDADETDDEGHLEQAGGAVPGPRPEPFDVAVPATEHAVGPEVVPARRVLRQQVVDLPKHLETEEDLEPPNIEQHVADRVVHRHQRVAARLVVDEQPEDRQEQCEELDAVPEGQLACVSRGVASPRVSCIGSVWGSGHADGGCERLLAHEVPRRVRESKIDSMSSACASKHDDVQLTVTR